NVRGERNDSGGQAFQGTQMDGGVKQDFARFDFMRGGSASDGGAQPLGFSNQAKHDFGAGFVGHDVGRTASADRTDVERRLPENRIAWQRDEANLGERVEQRMNRR